jgi:hypothetical protein
MIGPAALAVRRRYYSFRILLRRSPITAPRPGSRESGLAWRPGVAAHGRQPLQHLTCWLATSFYDQLTGHGSAGSLVFTNAPTPATAVPEALTASLFGAGLAGLAVARRRKKTVSQA